MQITWRFFYPRSDISSERREEIIVLLTGLGFEPRHEVLDKVNYFTATMAVNGKPISINFRTIPLILLEVTIAAGP